MKLFAERDGVRIITNLQTWAFRTVPENYEKVVKGIYDVPG